MFKLDTIIGETKKELERMRGVMGLEENKDTFRLLTKDYLKLLDILEELEELKGLQKDYK